MKPITAATDDDMQNKLEELRGVLSEGGDDQGTGEVQEIQDKLERKELTIAFCGHFSAGKSSLINSLCGKAVMPASPLPTSANVVFIRSGAPRAVLSSSDPAQPPVEMPVEHVADYARNGKDYTRVELWDEIELLNQGGALLDTPGVDSNDAGHELATHSALHLADVVFYVMDYNHVSSETNLSFAKALSDYGKPVYMVVNQIDKHREEELSFARYRESVSQAFKVWNIGMRGIFYISLKREEHPDNMLPALRRTIQEILARGAGLLDYGAYMSAAQTVNDHLARLAEKERPQREALLEQAGGETEVPKLEEEWARLKQAEASGGETVWEERRQEWLNRIGKVIDSAQLMTPALREQAGLFLESRAPGFKVKGWFGGGGKTEAEKAKRRETFLSGLGEQTEAQLGWHVRQELRTIGQHLQLWDESWEERLDALLPQPEEAWISEVLPGGAMLSGESTLHYAAAVAAGVAGRYKRAAAAVLDALLAAPSPLRAAEAAAAVARRAELAARLPAARALAQLAAAQAAREARLSALLGAPVPLTSGLLPEVHEPAPRPVGGAALPGASAASPAPAAVAASAPTLAPAAAPSATPTVSAGPPPQADAAGGDAPTAKAQPRPPQARGRAMQAAARLAAAAELLAPHPAFGTGVRELTRRAAELRSGTFTVALFGAFSAGKSSFASALLGEAVLPVSPHPTTAAIIRVMAPGDGQRHNTARIRFKSREAMAEDLAYSFGALGLGGWQEKSWLEAVKRLEAAEIPAAGRAHFSFLKAAAAGWEAAESLLGQSIVADAAEFGRFAAEEEKACFVADIDFYYACPLTEQGIVLVDTPGADSIHARHTGITFQYMKNSDAIIFVTYYNHAFSRADKQLLSQLGRMKGSFALDKMFFVVNAADLAASEDELAAVVEYVRDGLQTAGIREPNLFALSSLQALREEQGGASGDMGFARFRQQFAKFLEVDLGSLAAASAAALLEQTKERLAKWIAAADSDAEHAERKLAALTDSRAAFEAAVKEFMAVEIGREWNQENEELLFHVVQRLRLQALDAYAEYFHPSLLQDGAGPLKRNFAIAMSGWVSQISGELERELLATTLRLERKAEALLAREADNWCRGNGARFDMPLEAPAPSGEWNTPEIPEGLLDRAYFSPEDYWAYFKNPKAFFEGQGKMQLRAKLEGPLTERLQELVHRMQGVFRDHYAGEIEQRKQQIAEYFTGLWQEWEDSLKSLKVSGEELAHWQKAEAQLGGYREEMEAFYAG
ncbi:dynamin family protein [Paenibacillus macerans]|uniref:dynamin family protein n=1 Tax=Paenibacillus macerans TaxID=44252 RepID=UPI00203FB489|nr:dynamin family protein [Paenibacillus macerans]MCM3698044.1 dynamin family protein [Paenibacillus macerans]